MFVDCKIVHLTEDEVEMEGNRSVEGTIDVLREYVWSEGGLFSIASN